MALLRWTHGDITAARHWVQQILDDRDRAARTWKFPALHLMTIIDFAHGRDVAENAVLLDVLSSGVGATGRTIALNSRGIDLLWTDGDGAIAAADEATAIADDLGLVAMSMMARSVKTLAVAVHRPGTDALEATLATQGFAVERGVWSWVLSGLGTAAAVFEVEDRPDVAVMLLGARDAASYHSGLTAGLAELQAERLRREHPDRFAAWWTAGRELHPRDAGALVVRTARELLAR